MKMTLGAMAVLWFWVGTMLDWHGPILILWVYLALGLAIGVIAFLDAPSGDY